MGDSTLIERRVDFYAKGIAIVPVYFPEGQINCRHCLDFCKYNKDLQTYYCLLTHRYIDKNHLNKRDTFCPIELEVSETPTF